MTGAFWVRHTPNTTTSRPIDTLTMSEATDDTSAEDSVSDPSIKVADLPNAGNEDTTPTTESNLTSSEADTIQFIRTSSGSTKAYDEMSDKYILYPSGTARYSNKDLKGKVSTNRASLTSYGISLVKTLNGFPFYKTSSPTEITYNIYSGKDTKDTGLTELDATNLAFQSASKNLLIQSVPSDLLTLHTKLLNTFDRISQLIKNMEGVKTDKLLALNSARQYVEEEKYALMTLGQINAFFKDKNITLSEENRLKLSVAIYK